MRKSVQFDIQSSQNFYRNLVDYSREHKRFCLLNSNQYTAQNRLGSASNLDFEWIAGIGETELFEHFPEADAFKKFRKFCNSHEDWMFGALSYDLKNDVENHLSSSNFDGLRMPSISFFIPRLIFIQRSDHLVVEFLEDQYSESGIRNMIMEILNKGYKNKEGSTNIDIRQRIDRNSYLAKLKKIKDHIQRGDIYEINFCQEFYGEGEVNPYNLYLDLNETSPNPFSAFLKMNDKFVLSASPERFLRKKGREILTQPIKGTAARGRDEKEDEIKRAELLNDEKERAENVMIVDLCRNDLSRIATRNSVEVPELFGIYQFPQVFQMISTVKAVLDEKYDFVDAIEACYPMGSMTGAPKIRAMEIIEQYEETKRGMYSGAVGYITPERDFDFNVVIRSILYNHTFKYLSFIVGGAITSLSIPEKEYEECLLKAKAMFDILGVQSPH